MINIRDFASSIFGAEISAPLIDSQDLSIYRGFQFGTTLFAIAEQGHLSVGITIFIINIVQY